MSPEITEKEKGAEHKKKEEEGKSQAWPRRLIEIRLVPNAFRPAMAGRRYLQEEKTWCCNLTAIKSLYVASLNPSTESACVCTAGSDHGADQHVVQGAAAQHTPTGSGERDWQGIGRCRGAPAECIAILPGPHAMMLDTGGTHECRVCVNTSRLCEFCDGSPMY